MRLSLVNMDDQVVGEKRLLVSSSTLCQGMSTPGCWFSNVNIRALTPTTEAMRVRQIVITEADPDNYGTGKFKIYVMTNYQLFVLSFYVESSGRYSNLWSSTETDFST